MKWQMEGRGERGLTNLKMFKKTFREIRMKTEQRTGSCKEKKKVGIRLIIISKLLFCILFICLFNHTLLSNVWYEESNKKIIIKYIKSHERTDFFFFIMIWQFIDIHSPFVLIKNSIISKTLR